MLYEMLIRTVDKGSGADQMKRGHVVVAMPAGHQWSTAERNNPEWTIVKVDATEGEIETLSGPSRMGGSPRAVAINLDGFAGSEMSRQDLYARML